MTTEEMKSFLRTLNIDVVNARGSELQGYCPAHEERTGHADKNPSWWINSDTGQHICFSCQFKGGIGTLINQITDGDLANYSDWFNESTNMLSRLNNLFKEKPKEKPDVIITESMLSAFVDPPKEILLARGILQSAANQHEVLWNAPKDNWILPIRNVTGGVLLGWQEKGTTSRFFRNYPPRMQKSLSLFGYQQYQGGNMIVVESPLDVARLTSVGISGGVATYGTQISSTQFNAMRGAERLIIAMDNDDAGRKASYALYDMCREHGKEAWFFDYRHTDMKDVGGMSKVEIESGLENAKHITRGRK